MLLFVLIPYHSSACTTFFLHYENKKILGTNYDWHIGFGMIVINQRGVLKKAMAVAREDKVSPPEWVSRYGSLTFNQYGRETPMGGINETGLVVHQMMLRQSRFPEPDARRPIKNLQWIQYQLDNFNSVKQVVESNSTIRIQQKEIPGLHYLAADKSGNCAVLEWIDGKFICHTGDAMPFKVLSNNTYEDSLRYIKRHQNFGGTLALDASSSMSLDRFVRAAKMVKEYPGAPGVPMVDYAFDILKKVGNETTMWSIVYDINLLQVYFKTRSHKKVRVVDLKMFDLSCNKPVKMMDLDAKLSGDISDNFFDYTQELNQNLIKNAFKRTPFSRHISEEAIYRRSLYPESTTCFK